MLDHGRRRSGGRHQVSKLSPPADAQESAVRPCRRGHPTQRNHGNPDPPVSGVMRGAGVVTGTSTGTGKAARRRGGRVPCAACSGVAGPRISPAWPRALARTVHDTVITRVDGRVPSRARSVVWSVARRVASRRPGSRSPVRATPECRRREHGRRDTARRARSLRCETAYTALHGSLNAVASF